MSDEIWQKMLSDSDLIKAKKSRNQEFITKKDLTANLPALADYGWEKYKEYKDPKFVKVLKHKSVSELFEDQIWLIFQKMGFTEINSDNDFYLPYDHHDRSKLRQIDILAADSETVLIVTCRASGNITEGDFTEDILTLKKQMDGLRREVVKHYSNHKVKFIWATKNYTLKRQDLELLENSGIIHFNDSIVKYYDDLVKHLGSSSRYQLLGNLFANQEIRNMDNRIPAIRGKMGGYTYYSFSIEPEKLLKIGYVLHRNEAHQNMMPTYQRLIKKNRLQQVREFINDGGYFPNSIIVSIDTGGKGLVFDQSATKVDGTISKIGVLHIPKKYRSAYIIDGQHRLYGYSDSDYASTHTVPVVAFVDLDRNEQIKIFMDINENQKAVPKTLRVTLNADMLWDSPNLNEQRQALRSKIAQMLGEEPTSPLYMRVVIGENESSTTRSITVEALQSALKKCKFFTTFGKKNEIVTEGTFDCGTNQATCDLFYPFIERCLIYIRDSCPQEWDKGDSDSGMLTMNRGIQAVIRVIDDIVNLLIEKETYFPNKQSPDDLYSLIEYYLKPLTEYLNNLTPEQRKDLRGYFGGGADTRFWRAYQKAIADKRPDFRPDGLNEFWVDESKVYNAETEALIPEIENRLKQIISYKLEGEIGSDWLVKALPKSVYTAAKQKADEINYENIRNDRDEEPVSLWDCISFTECKEIVIDGKHWSMFFAELLVLPSEKTLSGGKEAKTEWMLKINGFKNKLRNESYSVPLSDYRYIKEVHNWIMDILIE